ncbi:MAG: hypothetical protein ACE5FG_05525 [Myxococcota bacterium]
MGIERFVELAAELAERDRELPSRLAGVREGATALHAIARSALEHFQEELRKRGAEHLASFAIGPVEPDEKHVDCLQFRVSRGRWEILCVAKAREEGPKVTLVGPFRRGKPEKPCRDFPLRSDEVERGLEDVLVELIRQATDR